MFILFSLIVMRTSGAIALNPLLGRSNVPIRVRTAFIFALSLLLYVGVGGSLGHEPVGMLEYGMMLVKELLFGFALGFTMELTFFVVRFASSVMDYSMGLSMAQIYDPQYNTQMTISSGLFYAFLALLFLAVNGHVRLIAMFFSSAYLIPFGEVTLRPELTEAMMGFFSTAITMGMQLAFPLVAMELIAEAAVGILMRIIPQINVFVVNFQVKIVVGLMILVMMFSPMADRLYTVIGTLFTDMQQVVRLMMP